MRLPFMPRVARATGPAIAAVLLLSDGAAAQDVTEPALKAAYIYNFAKFTEWPGTPLVQEPFVLCVAGDAAVSDGLERAIKGRSLAGQPLRVVSLLPADEPPPACRLLYISGLSAGRAAQLVSAVRDRPVLTISDADGFADLGGIARFFFKNGQLRFTVDLASTARARLQISSRLLSLAIRQ
jgi:hypothetical protein